MRERQGESWLLKRSGAGSKVSAMLVGESGRKMLMGDRVDALQSRPLGQAVRMSAQPVDG